LCECGSPAYRRALILAATPDCSDRAQCRRKMTVGS
jgi:hypothetical protein